MRGTRKNRKGKIEKNQKVKEGPCIFPFKHKKKEYDVCMNKNLFSEIENNIINYINLKTENNFKDFIYSKLN